MSRHLPLHRAGTLLLALLTATACRDADTAGRYALDPGGEPVAARAADARMSVAALAALDTGNAAYRDKRYRDALAQYRRATEAAPEHAAPWYGVLMVARELQDASLADSALRRVQALSADTAALEVHEGAANATGMSPHALPPGHPSERPLPPGHPAPATSGRPKS